MRPCGPSTKQSKSKLTNKVLVLMEFPEFPGILVSTTSPNPKQLSLTSVDENRFVRITEPEIFEKLGEGRLRQLTGPQDVTLFQFFFSRC